VEEKKRLREKEKDNERLKREREDVDSKKETDRSFHHTLLLVDHDNLII
jgi:hypothetical protein